MSECNFAPTPVPYRIQASTNLATWTTMSNLNSATSPILITDPQAGSFTRRFYRGVTP